MADSIASKSLWRLEGVLAHYCPGPERAFGQGGGKHGSTIGLSQPEYRI